jgi:threonine/homoserine/homoserine lactone efflux protein
VTVSSELGWALLLFVVVTSFTPGPNNAMLLATGLNFGLRRGQAHLWGVALGFAVMVLAVGLGLGAVFQAYPAAYTVLRYMGAAYLLYLAWQIATAGEVKEGQSSGRPITFLEAAAFQWLNPKGWVMAVGAVSTYAAVAPFPFNMVLIASLCGTVGVLSSITWLGFGTALKRLLTDPAAVRAVNIAMALLLVASLWPILSDAWR